MSAEQKQWVEDLNSLDDEKYPIVKEIILKSKSNYPEGEAITSVAFIQRTARVGYSQAKRLMSRMVDEGLLQEDPNPIL